MMLYRPLGKTGINVSVVSFGAGPVSALMTSAEKRDEQRRVVRRAIELGINWFDTAATYGEGRSEESLGRVLGEVSGSEFRVPSPAPEKSKPETRNTELGTRNTELETFLPIHVATKVRIPPERTHDLRSYVLRSLEESLTRLRLPRVSLLQVHNSITRQRGNLPTSLSPEDVLGPGGVLDGMLELQKAGLVAHLGLTALGDPASLTDVLRSGQFATVQAPYNLLNPSAGRDMPADFRESNLGNLFATCQSLNVGVFAIRVYAGGALAGQPPSAHTLTTKFFPLDLYHRDEARAEALQKALPPGISLPEVALRFAIAHPGVASELVGFATPEQVEQAVAFAERGPLPKDEIERLHRSIAS
jgi:aryl-alcohol dehydrogenase-like predicted oxidoreductase